MLPTVNDEAGKKFNQVLTVTDRGSKQVILIPCWRKDYAPVVASQFLHEVVRHRDPPSSIISGRDVNNTSVFWKSMCHHMDIKAIMTSHLHPQANVAAERYNQPMKQVPRTIVLSKQQQPDNWQISNWLLLFDFV